MNCALVGVDANNIVEKSREIRRLLRRGVPVIVHLQSVRAANALATMLDLPREAIVGYEFFVGRLVARLDDCYCGLWPEQRIAFVYGACDFSHVCRLLTGEYHGV